MALTDRILFTTLVFDEKGMTLYKSGFDTPKRKVSTAFLEEELENLSSIDSVRVKVPLTPGIKDVLKGKTIGSLHIAGGIERDTRGLSMIPSVNLLDIEKQEIPELFPYPKNVQIFWAKDTNLKATMATPLTANIINLVGAKISGSFYISDDCQEIRLNANDLHDVVLPKGINKIALVGGTIPKDFGFEQYPALREICFNQGVKLPKKVNIPKGVKVDMEPSVDLSATEAFAVSVETFSKSPKIMHYLNSRGILHLKKNYMPPQKVLDTVCQNANIKTYHK